MDLLAPPNHRENNMRPIQTGEILREELLLPLGLSAKGIVGPSAAATPRPLPEDASYHQPLGDSSHEPMPHVAAAT
jgi:hypothetical protein